MKDKKHEHKDFSIIERAIQYIGEHYALNPGLPEIAKAVGLSEFHFQRLFQKWAGVSPKKFIQYLTLNRAKILLDRGSDILSSAYEAGLSSPGRLHDLFVSIEAMSPGEYKRKGLGLAIRYGFHATPFGLSLIGVTGRGICYLAFLDSADKHEALNELKSRWLNARFIPAQKETRDIIDTIFFNKDAQQEGLKVLVGGPSFRIKVWEALLRIPSGTVLSYGDVAKLAGCPGAARAVGSALAGNLVAYLIPCHRVIKSSGIIGEYRWGSVRKNSMLVMEHFKEEQSI